jgi:hypothetical protein
MKSKIVAAIIASSLVAQIVFGHGENKPGPNGGFIRMPGAFHTELVPIGSNSLKVYLLDINWKNPTVKDSSLKVTHLGSKITEVCKIKSNFYICQFPASVDLVKKGELSVEAQRENQIGAVVSYELPFKLQKGNAGHGGHH